MNVLIGTTTDSGFKLQVTGTGSSNRIRIKEISDNTAATFLEVENSDNHAATFGIGGTNRSDILDNKAFANAQSGTDGFALGTEGSDPILFYTNGLANTNERARITSGGNLLIGTTTDSGKKLQINSDTTYDGIQITGANIPTLGIIDTTNNVKLVVYTRDNDATIGTETNHVFTLQTNAVERARLSTAGNLLIGTTTDSGNKLEVAGGIRQTANNPILIINNQGSSQTGTLYFRDAFGGAAIAGRIQTAGGALSLRTATSGSDDVVIKSTGNVLIGTTSDNGQKLQVTGNIRITGGLQDQILEGFY